jgi:hypothetical protein
MADVQLDALARVLGAEPPAALAALEPHELEDLARAIADARARQDAALDASAEAALGYIPRVLRGPVRRTLGL